MAQGNQEGRRGYDDHFAIEEDDRIGSVWGGMGGRGRGPEHERGVVSGTMREDRDIGRAGHDDRGFLDRVREKVSDAGRALFQRDDEDRDDRDYGDSRRMSRMSEDRRFPDPQYRQGRSFEGGYGQRSDRSMNMYSRDDEQFGMYGGGNRNDMREGPYGQAPRRGMSGGDREDMRGRSYRDDMSGRSYHPDMHGRSPYDSHSQRNDPRMWSGQRDQPRVDYRGHRDEYRGHRDEYRAHQGDYRGHPGEHQRMSSGGYDQQHRHEHARSHYGPGPDELRGGMNRNDIRHGIDRGDDHRSMPWRGRDDRDREMPGRSEHDQRFIRDERSYDEHHRVGMFSPDDDGDTRYASDRMDYGDRGGPRGREDREREAYRQWRSRRH